MLFQRLFLVFGIFVVVNGVFAANVKVDPSASLIQNAEKGWWFYDEEINQSIDPDLPQYTQKPEKSKTDPCLKKSTWKPSCGFVNPDKDFEFQALQRDKLLESMTLNPEDPKAVEAVQRYMKWVVQKAVATANMWQYNMVQNPDLDPSVKQPISNFGLMLMTEVKTASADNVFKVLQKEGALVYFTRSDCTFCHSMWPHIQNVANSTGIELWNASLDSKCMSGAKNCKTGDVSMRPAQALQVNIVPSLFLYVKPNTWIRVATGVVATDLIKSRISSFFLAYRQALLKGVAPQNGAPAVSFNSDDLTGASSKPISSGAASKPSESDIRSLLSQ